MPTFGHVTTNSHRIKHRYKCLGQNFKIMHSQNPEQNIQFNWKQIFEGKIF